MLGNPPTMVTPEGRLPICGEHAAGLARAGVMAEVVNTSDLEGSACHICELERFVLSAQTATTLVMETLEDGDAVLAGERGASVPLEMVAVKRTAPNAFLLTFQEGSTWTVTIAPADPVGL